MLLLEVLIFEWTLAINTEDTGSIALKQMIDDDKSSRQEIIF